MKGKTLAWIQVLFWLDLAGIITLTGHMTPLMAWIYIIAPCVWYLVLSYHMDSMLILFDNLHNLLKEVLDFKVARYSRTSDPNIFLNKDDKK